MEAASFRKPKLHFDVVANTHHVTFDDGKNQRRNVPWMHYIQARWDHTNLDTITIEIGECVVTILGHNLGALFLAVEERTLARIRALPLLMQDRDREHDSFATEIRFTSVPKKSSANPSGQSELAIE